MTSEGDFAPYAFDRWRVTLAAPILLVGLAFLVESSPLAFLMGGFHVWMHELGHATVAWLAGFRALPLPLGWTSVSGERSVWVYAGVLFLLVVLAVAGWRSWTPGAVILAAALMALQFYLTWRLPPLAQHQWQIFAGVGGQFYLSAFFMMLFFVPLPEAFRWGACRYVVFFIAACCFIDAYSYWYRVHRGLEDIPWGSMINGEDDGGGDMNILRDEYGWTNHRIMGAYYDLGRYCLYALLLVWAAAVAGLDRALDRLMLVLRVRSMTVTPEPLA